MTVKIFNLVLGVNETRFLVNMNSVSVNEDWKKVDAIQSKNGILMGVGVSVKN